MTKERSARAAVMKKVEQQQHTKKAGDENIIQQVRKCIYLYMLACMGQASVI